MLCLCDIGTFLDVSRKFFLFMQNYNFLEKMKF